MPSLESNHALASRGGKAWLSSLLILSYRGYKDCRIKSDIRGPLRPDMLSTSRVESSGRFASDEVGFRARWALDLIGYEVGDRVGR